MRVYYVKIYKCLKYFILLKSMCREREIMWDARNLVRGEECP